MNWQPQIILHAGGPKTGSSSIQEFYNDNTQSLHPKEHSLDLPFAFLKDGNGNNLSRLADSIQRGVANEARIFAILNSQIAKKSRNREILNVFSAEHAGNPGLDFLQAYRLSTFLGTLGSVSVLYYIRPLIDLSLSLYAQGLKASAQLSAEPYLKRFMMGDGGARHILYFNQLYGPDNVQTVPFSRDEFVDGDIRVDFASRLGAKSFIDSIKEAASEVPSINEKIDWPMFMILRKIYISQGLHRGNTPPASFIQFITVGNWNGDRLCHRDLFSPAQIRLLHKLSQDEFCACQALSIKMPGPTKDVAYYLDGKNRKDVNLDDYLISLTEAQHKHLTGICNKFRRQFSDNNLNATLQKYLQFSKDETFRAVPLLSAILKACIMINN
jgi:hypothetical protein